MKEMEEGRGEGIMIVQTYKTVRKGTEKEGRREMKG
jgi:hypothetical protein